MIYIQSNTERTLPHHFDAACAMFGAIDNVADYRLTSYEEVVSGKFDQLIKSRLFVGSVEFMQAVFNRIGKTDVKLPRNSNRIPQIITLGAARNLFDSSGVKIFIKPVENKLFTGFVLDDMEYESIKNVPSESLVMVYEEFKYRIESEWRIYIHNGKMIDSRNYSGDFMVTPNYAYAAGILKFNEKDFPCAYTMDIGVLTNGENVVIEYNDMWAIGNYGIPNDLYVRALRDRYFEIVKN